jgi:hypothetical protein
LNADKIKLTPEKGYSLKPHETRKDVPGFGGFVLYNVPMSSNTFRESLGKASAFVRIKASIDSFIAINNRQGTAFLKKMEGGINPNASEIRYDDRGFIELVLEDYPIEQNDSAVENIIRAATLVKEICSMPEAEMRVGLLRV